MVPRSTSPLPGRALPDRRHTSRSEGGRCSKRQALKTENGACKEGGRRAHGAGAWCGQVRRVFGADPIQAQGRV